MKPGESVRKKLVPSGNNQLFKKINQEIQASKRRAVKRRRVISKGKTLDDDDETDFKLDTLPLFAQTISVSANPKVNLSPLRSPNASSTAVVAGRSASVINMRTSNSAMFMSNIVKDTSNIRKEREQLEAFGMPPQKRALNIKIQELQQQVLALRERYNQQMSFLKEKKDKLYELQQKFKHLKLEDDVLNERQASMIVIDQKMDRLKRLKVEIQRYRDYRSTLKHVESRLYDEQLTFDSTLQAYEEALKVRKQEANDTYIAAKMARQNRIEMEEKCDKLKDEVDDQRKNWMREIDEKRNQLIQKEELRRWRGEQHAKEVLLNMELDGDLDERQELALKERDGVMQRKRINMEQILADAKSELAEHEKAFRKIYLAIGLSDTEEIIEKYKNREGDTNRMEENIELMQNQLSELKEEKLRLHHQISARQTDVKSDLSREHMEGLSTDLDTHKHKLKVLDEQAGRVADMVLSISQTVGVLSGTLAQIQNTRIPQQGGVIEQLAFIEDCLVSIIRDMSNKNSERLPHLRRTSVSTDQPLPTARNLLQTEPEFNKNPSNVRVKPLKTPNSGRKKPPIQKGYDFRVPIAMRKRDSVIDMLGLNNDQPKEDKVISRKMMKSHSQQILRDREAKKRMEMRRERRAQQALLATSVIENQSMSARPRTAERRSSNVSSI
eukprot:TRINITY_DN774270_c0_g1_i1.p1 TRINITY_DN774270_c0_g1~~TRINITY_DN774270_c0_g1_i1.p1  ORF type:complete len:669 (+),score=206.86 TRINITY_DN774270_c0_g1_i1:79-2085(+)